MISFRLEKHDRNYLIQLEHGQPIDILGEMETLGMISQLEHREMLLENGECRP